MTDQEEELQKRRATDLIKAIGGILAILLGLRPIEGTIIWDPRKARFIAEGQYVTMRSVREELGRFENAVKIKMRSLADDLEAGRIDLQTWTQRMRDMIASTHIAMAAAAVGSVQVAVGNATVQKRIAAQNIYLERFSRDIGRGKLTPKATASRAASYVFAAGVTFAVVEQQIKAALNFTQAMRTCYAIESCGECLDIAGEWMPIDEMPEIGSLLCRDRCQCVIDYR